MTLVLDTRRGRRIAGVLLWLAIAPSASAQQAIRGVVRTTVGGAIDGATVEARDSANRVLASTVTDTSGRYLLRVDARQRAVSVAARRLGFTPGQAAVPRRGPATVELTINFDLRSAAAELPVMHASTERPRPFRPDAGIAPPIGMDQAALDQRSGLSGDLSGDLTSSLAMVPGITLVPDAAGSLAPSAFGVSPDQNGLLLNGADFGSTPLPRDVLVQTVRLSTYDPRQGGFSGVLVSANLPTGTSFRRVRALHVTADEPALQWTTATARSAGSTYGSVVVSGQASGAFVTDKKFYNAALQVSRRTSGVTSLLDAPANTLRALGVSPDSVHRLLSIARAIQLPLGVPIRDQSSTQASGIVRLDFTPNAQGVIDTKGAVLYLLASAAVSSNSGFGVSPMTLPTQAVASRHADGRASLTFSPYIASALDETKTTLAIRDDWQTPTANLPNASLALVSDLANGDDGLATIALGGSPAGRRDARQIDWETSSDVSWMTPDMRHAFDLYADTHVQAHAQSQAFNPLGTFAYASLDDLESGMPTSLSRSFQAARSHGATWQNSLAFSDAFDVAQNSNPSGIIDRAAIRLQYGVRVDEQRFMERASANGEVDSIFHRRSNRLPNNLSVAPMAGFTWNMGAFSRNGVAAFGGARSVLSGGVREYVGTISTATVDDVLRQNGTAGNNSVLCVGPAAPFPNWSDFEQSEASIPLGCAPGYSSTSYVQGEPAVALFAPEFRPPASWRAEMHWRGIATSRLELNAGLTETVNTNQPDYVDLNFNGRERFVLASEDRRPVFVPATDIIAGSGASVAAGSRVEPALAAVLEHRSDLRSTQQQLVAGFDYRAGLAGIASTRTAFTDRVTWSAGAQYVRSVGRLQMGGFQGTTAGDPSRVDWAAMSTPRDAVQITASVNIAGVASLSAFARVSSGRRYTPMVDGDINGDGLANDRAFIFDPARTSDTAVASGMSRLLATAPGAARNCLARQLSAVAGPASCVGSPTATLPAIIVTLDPYRVGLGNRGSLRLLLSNPLAGLDQLAHGSQHLAGWGETVLPDPVLLEVRGFSQNRQAFVYAVNPAFGSTSQRTVIGRTPFRITLDVQVDVGPDRESETIRRYMRGQMRDGTPPDSAHLEFRLVQDASGSAFSTFNILMRYADSLRLTTAQRTEVARCRARLEATHDSVYGALAGYLALPHADYGAADVRDRWHAAIEHSIRVRYEGIAEIRALLDPGQLEWLESHNLSSVIVPPTYWIERIVRMPLVPE
jgi:hypothetical protein